MKKMFCFLIVCVLLLPTQLISYAMQTEQETQPEAEIIILLDQSDSMKKGLPGSSLSCATQAEQWTQELCVLLAEMPVSFRIMTFDEGCKTLIEHNDMYSASVDSLKKDLDRIGDVKFDGPYTNHLKALQTASEEGELIERSYVIISDGELTLAGNGNVEEASDCFQELCKNLAQKGNYIYLLGLGTKLGMFEELREEEGITVQQNQEVDLVKLSKMLLRSIDYTITDTSQMVSEQFPIRVDDDYAKIIINITSLHSDGLMKLEKKG